MLVSNINSFICIQWKKIMKHKKINLSWTLFRIKLIHNKQKSDSRSKRRRNKIRPSRPLICPFLKCHRHLRAFDISQLTRKKGAKTRKAIIFHGDYNRPGNVSRLWRSRGWHLFRNLPISLTCPIPAFVFRCFGWWRCHGRNMAEAVGVWFFFGREKRQRENGARSRGFFSSFFRLQLMHNKARTMPSISMDGKILCAYFGDVFLCEISLYFFRKSDVNSCTIVSWN